MNTSILSRPNGQTETPRPTPRESSGGRLRELLKATARALATILVLPMVFIYRLKAAVIGHDRALEGSSETLSLIPGLLGRYLRRAFLARVLVKCHPTAAICFGSIFSKAGACIEENVYIGPRCHIGLAHIEQDVLIAAGVHITSGSRMHGIADVSVPIREQTGVYEAVRIGAGAWIGSAAIVMADVGCDTVVGAGAVVTKPLPDRVVAVGVPAKVIRSRESPQSDT